MGKTAQSSQIRASSTMEVAAGSSAQYIDEFFGEYSTFDYHNDQSSTGEFYRMCEFFNWERDDDDRDEAHKRFRTALVRQFNGTYGVDVSNIEPWHRLCHVLEIDPLPQQVRDAQQTVKGLFVNLVDLVDTNKTGEPVKKFQSLSALRDYTIGTGKYFPKKSAYAGGVLKFLLREIHGPRNRTRTFRGA